jgi:hypothetical protein
MPYSQRRDSAPLPGLRRKPSGVVRGVPREVEGSYEGQGGLSVPTADVRSSCEHTP